MKQIDSKYTNQDNEIDPLPINLAEFVDLPPTSLKIALTIVAIDAIIKDILLPFALYNSLKKILAKPVIKKTIHIVNTLIIDTEDITT